MGKLEGYKYITYLIGSMEETAEGDDGSSKRKILQEEILIRKVYPINPVQLEKYKININTEKAKIQMGSWLKNKQISEFKDFSRLIWKGKYLLDKKYGLIHIPGDIDYVKMSDWVTCVYNKGDKPCINKDAQILMGDFTHRKIKDIRVGDDLIGFKKNKGKTKTIKSTVLGVYNKGYKKTIKIMDKHKNQLFLTPEHRMLTRNKKMGSKYIAVNKIDNCFSLKVAKTSTSFYSGWVSGYFTHDGSIVQNWKRHEITALSDKYEEIKTVQDILKKLKIYSIIRPVKRKNKQYYMICICKISDFYKLFDLIKNLRPNNQFAAGWVAGSIDAGGWIDRESIRYSQSSINIKNTKQFESYLNQLNITYNKNERQRKTIKIEGRKIKTNPEINYILPKYVAFAIPSQLLYKQKKINFTINKLNSPVNILDSNKKEVWDLVTTSGNFVANGFIVHNCGTYGEGFMSFEHDIPIYLITDVKEEEETKELKGSFLQSIYGSGGAVFRDIGAYLNFIENKYNLNK